MNGRTLKTGNRLAQAEDDRVAIVRIIGNPDSGRGVKREATKALDTNTPEALRAFLETGYRLAQAEDDRVAVARILADPTISAALRAAAEDVIDGTAEELRYFLETGAVRGRRLTWSRPDMAERAGGVPPARSAIGLSGRSAASP
ncbi:ALF repeat-containing protein [Streptomyces sp. AK010]|uniref:ALF repeat-containing protein n=1 Tax=Streptomyces sp. AK010 TaxID=2723074 RepID=UPI0016198FE6